MARDRLAAMRAAQNQGGYSQPPSGPTYTTPPHSSNAGYTQQYDPPQNYGRNDSGAKEESYEMQTNGGRGGALDMQSFMAEISDLNDGIRSINANVDKIRDLHSRALSQLDEAQHAQITAQLQATTTETSRMTNSLKNRINSLQQQNGKLPPGEDSNVRRTQVGALKKRFMDTIQKYQSVEQESRQKYRARMERQYKIVKPDATQDEIRAAIESDDGGQVFSQALLSSNRYGDARSAYKEVQERHEDIRKIEKTITELMTMFNDLASMVEEQDPMIVNIEQNANNVEADMGNAEGQMQKAVKSARAARRKRWICFWVIVAIIVVVVIIVLAYLGANGKL